MHTTEYQQFPGNGTLRKMKYTTAIYSKFIC